MSIASEITRLQGVKSDILTAIGNKGVTVPADSALDDCPDLIASIETEGPDLSGYTIYDYFVKNGNNRAYNSMWSGSSFCDALSLLLSESMSTHRYSLKMSLVLDNSTIPSVYNNILSTYQTGDGQSAFMDIWQTDGVLYLRVVLAYTSQFQKPTATYSVALSGSYTRLDIVVSNEKMVVNGVNCAWSSTGKVLKGARYVIAPYTNTASQNVGSRFEYIAILDNDKVKSEIVPAKNNANGHLGWLDVKSAEFYDNTDYNCWDVPADSGNVFNNVPLINGLPDDSYGSDGDVLVSITKVSFDDGGTIIPTQSDNTNCSASNEGYGPAYQAFDGNDSTYWSTYDDIDTDQWVTYDFGSNPQKIVSCSIRPRVYDNYQQIRNFKVQGSNDNTNWTTLLYTQMPNHNAVNWNYYELNNDTAYRYYRLFALDTNGRTVTIFEIHYNTVKLSNPNWEIPFITRYKKQSGVWVQVTSNSSAIPWFT